MSPEPKEVAPAREDACEAAREALSDAFFFDAGDPTGPFGNETAREVFAALEELRDDDPRGGSLELLRALLQGWEVADEGWDAVTEDEVQALGEADEYSLLTRDEAVLGLAFGDIVIRGRMEPEVRRRAVLALARQALPALLHGFGDQRKAREAHVARMREVLAKKWD